MGSKNKLLAEIYCAVSDIPFDMVIDAFSGSGVVSYMFKAMGKTVIANDHMHMSTTIARALIENNDVQLTSNQVDKLMSRPPSSDQFVHKTFRGLYFSDSDNRTIDNVRANIQRLRRPEARAIAMTALIRACMKRRPRGVFTYTGDRYNDGRLDLQRSIAEHFIDAVEQVNRAVFDNQRPNLALNSDALELRARRKSLVYLDPPYYTPGSDNEYVRRYHFVEGLARNWRGVEIQQNTLTKKFKSYETPFSTRDGAAIAFERLFRKFRESSILVSYSSNSLPSLDEMVECLSRYKDEVTVIPIRHRYSFGNQNHKIDDNRNLVNEYLFLGRS